MVLTRLSWSKITMMFLLHVSLNSEFRIINLLMVHWKDPENTLLSLVVRDQRENFDVAMQ